MEYVNEWNAHAWSIIWNACIYTSIGYITFLPSNKKMEVNHAIIQATNCNYCVSLSGGFLMQVDFLTGTLLEVLESLLSFAAVDGKYNHLVLITQPLNSVQ